MVRSILFPKPINIKYERDGVKFIGMMAIVGVVGFTFSIVISIYECLTIPATILKSLDLGKSHIQSIFKVFISETLNSSIFDSISKLSKVTTIVPPALPAALSIGIVYAQHRI